MTEQPEPAEDHGFIHRKMQLLVDRSGSLIATAPASIDLTEGGPDSVGFAPSGDQSCHIVEVPDSMMELTGDSFYARLIVRKAGPITVEDRAHPDAGHEG